MEVQPIKIGGYVKKLYIFLVVSFALNIAKGQQWTTYTINNGLVWNWVDAIAIDKQNIKWFGTEIGLSRFDGTIWTNYTTQNGLPGDVVRSIAVDSLNNKWFGTEDGYGMNCKISKFDGITWTIFSPSFLINNSVWAIAIDQLNNKWFGTTSGVLMYDDANWTIYTTSNGLVNNSVTAVAIDSQGNLYITDYPGIRVVGTDGTIRSVPGSDSAAGCVAADGAGNLFIAADGSTNKVFRLAAGVATAIAGNGLAGYSGDGGAAITAGMSNPWGIALDGRGNLYAADVGNNVVRVLRPSIRDLIIGAVVNAASETATPLASGMIVAVYGAGFGPVAHTTVAFNGIAAPLLYSFPQQLAAIVPYGVTGPTATMTVSSRGQASLPVSVPLADAAPGIFTVNQAGTQQAAAVNLDGTINSAVNPVCAGSYISLYATGEGQTSPAGVDGKLAGTPLPLPLLPVSVTVDDQPAYVQYAGGAPFQIAGLMQVNVLVPDAVRPGGYVPVVLKVGSASSNPGVTIAVAACR